MLFLPDNDAQGIKSVRQNYYVTMEILMLENNIWGQTKQGGIITVIMASWIQRIPEDLGKFSTKIMDKSFQSKNNESLSDYWVQNNWPRTN